jgi:hypothetical protein
MSESPPPRPLCSRMSRMRRSDTMTWMTTTAAVNTVFNYFLLVTRS